MKAQIITLLETSKMNYAEIAAEVGRSEKYIRSIHAELRKNLLEKIKRLTGPPIPSKIKGLHFNK